MARLVARKISATFFAFPVLNPLDPIGNVLFTSLLKDPAYLEKSPDMWAHLYAGMLMSYRDRIKEALETGPVVTTNYMSAFRVWYSASAGSKSLASWFPDLPVSDMKYNITGQPYPWHGNIPTQFSEELTNRINMGMIHYPKRLTPRFDLGGPEKLMHLTLNRVSATIANEIYLKYKTPLEEFHCYEREDYPVSRTYKKS